VLPPASSGRVNQGLSLTDLRFERNFSPVFE
jgi:hypothetical protein